MPVSGTSGGNIVGVQVSPSALQLVVTDNNCSIDFASFFGGHSWHPEEDKGIFQ